MLTIRKEQRRLLSDPFLLNWLDKQVRAAFPGHFAEVDAANLREELGASVERARAFGFSDYEVLTFVLAETMFGPDFPSDEEFAWAREILSGPAPPAARAAALRLACTRILVQRMAAA